VSVLDKALMYWRFARDLRKYLGEPLTIEQSRQLIRQRLAQRDQNLLSIVKKAVYDNERSPYLKLLQAAGCEYGDFKLMVESNGVEPTLSKLREKGVYIKLEEFKGRKDIIRGSTTISCSPNDFNNPYTARNIEVSSSATRSAGTRTMIDLDFFAANRAVAMAAMLDAFDAMNIPNAICIPILPGSGPSTLLVLAKINATPVKWFSPGDRRNYKPSLKSRLGTSYIVRMGRILGANFPHPQELSLQDAGQIARWVSDTISEYGSACFMSYVSAIVRICQAAREKGIDISGAKFITSGEPLTDIKRREIESTGARACPLYVFVEGGYMGIGCMDPASSDDVHFMKDSTALIQHRREVADTGISVDAFLFTSLLPSAPKILFNAENGDYGTIENRNCNCKINELGLIEHIHNIRGFDKLTGSGTTFTGNHLLYIIEEVLPARFGGMSTDYQMVEEEDEIGHTRMNLIVNPDIGIIDEAEIISLVISGLSLGSDSNRMMADVWRQDDILRIKRTRPYVTAQGKLMPLHIQKADKQR